MKKKYLGLLLMGTTILQAQQFPDLKPPVAEKQEHIRDIHGDKVNDPYYWMIDYFKKGKDSTKVVDYLKAENTYWTAMMKDTEPFREQLFQEMKARIKEKDESVPVFRNGYYYYTRTETGKQYFKYCRKKDNLNAPEEILLDVDKLAEGHPYFSAGGFSISPDNNKMIYGVDDVSRRQYKLFMKDLSTGKTTGLGIQNTTGGATWANDNKTIFYTSKNPETLLTEKIYRHTLGTDPSKDVAVYEEKDKSNYIGVGKSKNEKFIMIYSGATTSSETRYLDANDPNGTFKIFQPRIKDVLYDVTPLEDKFLITTNKDALNFKVVEAPLNKTGVENWKDFIPHRKDVLMEGISEFKNYLVFSERQNGLTQLVIYDRKTSKKEFLKFDEPAYTVYPAGNPEYNTDNFRFGYTSMITPSSQFEQNLKTGKRTLLKQQEVLGGYNKNNYETERLFATATDGTKIPVSIVYKKGFKKDGKAPLLLYAYGSYGSSMDAAFNSSRLSLLNRGFAYAIAHIRGGQEMGRQWYEDGKMMKKKNTFTDFINAGEYLVNQKYTSPKHLYAQGGSAGGLLMGAVANMKPELWNGVISQVPFVDVVNTMLDESIPLTTNEYDEWGNPNNKEAYFYMKSYSPYENIEKKNYPNILVTTGLHDSQVQYFEPAKWVAKLREMKTDKNVLLLKTDMDYGHGGASGRFDYLKDLALVYAFMFKLEGINK
ncbi:S9 family peptidase [Elizabethkingia meningoseptica]|uniref:S9 family peptidase n=1 Tax=Elizabethkingia meningoseptica TaxID=238 RepID=UPI0023AEC7FA|nr:S9 family peptidase [Elizabethkingia meningoseptica]MDE5437120.1 S9 family peptidase [Elizabethkingia meningoseptica]MDE5509749.1 S9 family peptidase [Elizabethkingia meningoseptica]MDE5514370.1 S9 family peptidase [Elizabethkingia meningoseptica]MDE5525017.1 S9 family peptidase [Elizabethkingia meningoseptica]MDE5528581.1 S9 family peptidase [Elizabethkingia meningoseptica]